jgi:uncharacterized membrane protein YfcA
VPPAELTPATIALLTLAAFLAGLVDAIAGGGGLLTVPALLLTGLPVPAVLGTNKGQAVFGSGAAFWRFWRGGHIAESRIAGPFLLGFCGSLAGAWLVTQMPNRALKPVVLVLLVAVAAYLAMRRDFGMRPGTLTVTPGERRKAALLAFGIGGYDGFFGPGTGTFLILANVRFLKDNLLAASAHAKVVNCASNLAAVLWFAGHGLVVWSVVVPMALAQALGAVAGSRLAVQGGDRFVRAVVLIVVVGLVSKLGFDLVTG